MFFPGIYTRENFAKHHIDEVFGKRVAIYDQCMKGLKELDFLELVRNNKEMFMKFFVFNENEKITFDDFEMDLQRSFFTSLLRKRLKRLF